MEGGGGRGGKEWRNAVCLQVHISGLSSARTHSCLFCFLLGKVRPSFTGECYVSLPVCTFVCLLSLFLPLGPVICKKRSSLQ